LSVERLGGLVRRIRQRRHAALETKRGFLTIRVNQSAIDGLAEVKANTTSRWSLHDRVNPDDAVR
jgi:hypothetical protein